MVVLFALTALAGSAQAGQYHVYACRTPAGESAPADGWSGSVTGSGDYAQNTCQQPGGALVAALWPRAGRTANEDTATWAFGAPAGEQISGATLWRAGDAGGGAAINAKYEFWFAGPNNINEPVNAFGWCVAGSECPNGLGNVAQPLAAENRLVVPVANLGAHLAVDASCAGASGFRCREGQQDANGYAAVVYVYAADLVLEQIGGPSAGNVSGELASAPVLAGTSDLAFSASDAGSGVYEAQFSVDGQLVQSTVLDENGGHCRNVGQTTDGLAAFLYVQPCQQAVSADVPFDTTRVPNGPHHLIVRVIDAAGNGAPVLDRNVTVSNPGAPGPPNGVNASVQATLSATWRGARRERITSSFGRAHSVVGRLTTAGGAPISGALIDLVALPAYTAAKPVQMASPRTGPDGSFSVRVPAGVSSRTLRFSYRPSVGAVPAVATHTLALSVRAGIALSVTPPTVSVGGSIQFHGRLRGGPIPPGGKALVLEARSAGSGWLEFNVIRTGARGRFSASYRFKFPGPAGYQFRVLSEPEADFPFAAGASNVVGVYER
ncbi:MAG: hypothetical protein M3Z95_03510 [Actinomycetota bacterium]|nr:hypothetical protein [Actinomycetota bacterium]